jgi:hypothetical protein
MKKLIAVLTILALAGIAQGEQFTIGGHNREQIAIIGLTATGAVETARFTANLLPIKKPEYKVVARAVLGFASGYVLLNIADRMHRPGVEANHADMFHAAKDGACLTGNITFALSVWDTWNLFKGEKKKK